MLMNIVLSTLRRAALSGGHIQRKPRNGLIAAYIEEALYWPYRGIYRGSVKKSPLCMETFIYRKIKRWLFKDNKKNGLLYCFNAVGKEIEYGRD